MAYLKLFHGRAGPGEVLDSSGIDGPIFGPHPCFDVLYDVAIQFHERQSYALCIHAGLVYYGGIYYADWSVFDGPPRNGELDFVAEFDPVLAVLPDGDRATLEVIPALESRNCECSVERREEEKTTMASEKKRPVHEVRVGRIRAAIWENESENGVRHNVTLSRLYKDGDDWKDSTSFGREDLLLVAKVADGAHSWIYAHGNGASDADDHGHEDS